MPESTLTVRGLTLALSTWGSSADPLVLVLHGYLDQGATWQTVGEALAARGYSVVAPDARGHGRSEHVGPGGYYHFSDYLVDLDGLAEQLCPNRPFALVGHSMGGAVASMYAGARPQRVDALINIEGLGPPRVEDDWAASQLARHLDQLRAPPTHKPLVDLDEAVTRMRRGAPELSEAVARRLAERVTAPHPDGLVWRWDALHRTRGAYAFDADRLLALLARIEAPMTLVVGERSPLRLADGDLRLARVRRSRRLDLPSGHNPHIECPERLAEVIDESVCWARGREEER